MKNLLLGLTALAFTACANYEYRTEVSSPTRIEGTATCSWAGYDNRGKRTGYFGKQHKCLQDQRTTRCLYECTNAAASEELPIIVRGERIRR